MLNKTVLMGRLTRDPDLRFTPSGIAVASFSLAVDRNFVSKDGDRETDFFDVVAWRGSAEFSAKYFQKGQMCCVEGRLQRRQWTDKDGNKRYAYEVVAESIHFAGSKRNSESVVMPEGYDPCDELAAA